MELSLLSFNWWLLFVLVSKLQEVSLSWVDHDSISNTNLQFQLVCFVPYFQILYPRNHKYLLQITAVNGKKEFFWKISRKIRTFCSFFIIPKLKHRQSLDSGLRKWAGIPGFGLESLVKMYRVTLDRSLSRPLVWPVKAISHLKRPMGQKCSSSRYHILYLSEHQAETLNTQYISSTKQHKQ